MCFAACKAMQDPVSVLRCSPVALGSPRQYLCQQSYNMLQYSQPIVLYMVPCISGHTEHERMLVVCH